MTISNKSMVVRGGLCVAILAAAACSPRRIPPLSVADLMEDRVMLDGVLMKCNQNPEKTRGTADCENARIAIERLASQSEPAEEAKRAAEFEGNREQLRAIQDKQRQEQAAKTEVDAYHLPVVPVEPPPPPRDPQSPVIGQSNP